MKTKILFFILAVPWIANISKGVFVSAEECPEKIKIPLQIAWFTHFQSLATDPVTSYYVSAILSGEYERHRLLDCCFMSRLIKSLECSSYVDAICKCIQDKVFENIYIRTIRMEATQYNLHLNPQTCTVYFKQTLSAAQEAEVSNVRGISQSGVINLREDNDGRNSIFAGRTQEYGVSSPKLPRNSIILSQEKSKQYISNDFTERYIDRFGPV